MYQYDSKLASLKHLKNDSCVKHMCRTVDCNDVIVVDGATLVQWLASYLGSIGLLVCCSPYHY